MSAINGGSFKSGLLSGALGSLAASATQGLVDDPTSFMGAAETVLNGAALGGLSSRISGGSFWDGVRNGAISAGLNHVASVLKEASYLDRYAKEKFGKNYKSVYGIKSLKWGSQMGKEVDGYMYDKRDQLIHEIGGDPTFGITTPDRRIYISNGIRNYKIPTLLVGVMGHEFIHSYQNMHYGSSFNSDFSEYSANQFTINFSIKNHWGDGVVKFYQNVQKMYPQAPWGYDYRNVPGFK